MNRFSFILNMPLLRKELLEQSTLKRTYIFRVVYLGLLALLVSGYMYRGLPRGFSDQRALLGTGNRIFTFIAGLQFLAVYLLMPVIMSPAIAGEKERGSLSLLLMSRLTPWQILLQKYLGSILIVFSFLLMGLPVLMTAFAFGGVSDRTVWGSILLLCITSLFTGALCMLFSSRSRNTLKALRDSYIYGGLLICFFPWLNGYWLYSGYVSGSIGVFSFGIACMITGTGFCLMRARKNLLQRALEHAGEEARKIKLREKMSAGIWRKNSMKPFSPIAWREQVKATGLDRYFTNIGLMCGLLFMVWTLNFSTYSQHICNLVLWGFAGLAVFPRLAGKLAEERTERTFDLLLVTPLSAKSILYQKIVNSTKQLRMTLAGLILVVFSGATVWDNKKMGSIPLIIYLFTSITTCVIVIYIIKWTGIFIGLKTRSKTQAIITAMSVLVSWTVLPFAADALWSFSAGGVDPPGFLMVFFSPGYLPWILAVKKLHEVTRYPLLLFLINSMLYGGLLTILRRRCVNNLNSYLGRI